MTDDESRTQTAHELSAEQQMDAQQTEDQGPTSHRAAGASPSTYGAAYDQGAGAPGMASHGLSYHRPDGWTGTQAGRRDKPGERGLEEQRNSDAQHNLPGETSQRSVTSQPIAGVQQSKFVERRGKDRLNGDQPGVQVRVIGTRGTQTSARGPGRARRLHGRVDLDRCLLWRRAMKGSCLWEALLRVRQVVKPGRTEIMAPSGDHKFLWGNYELLREQDGLLVGTVTPQNSGPTTTRNYVPQTLRKMRHLVERYFLWPGLGRDVETDCRQWHIGATRTQEEERRGRRRELGSGSEEASRTTSPELEDP